MRDQRAAHEALPFPLFVHVGFSGARVLFDAALHPAIDPIAFEADCSVQFESLIRSIGPELGLIAGRHALVGISQMAIGGDVLFARAFGRMALWHRVLLPQPRDGFLAASGSGGPHFSEAQKTEAIALLDASNVIEERVVSTSADAAERFDDTAIEILDESDILICLFSESTANKPGGSRRIFERARLRRTPTLELQIDVDVDGPRLRIAGWHDLDAFHLPKLPPVASGVRTPFPSASARPTAPTEALKAHASLLSKGNSRTFKHGAIVIIVTHVVATALATFALAMHHASTETLIACLLLVELCFLAGGLAAHRYLHRSEAIRMWANARLMAEVTRSALAVRQLPITLDYLGRLPFPIELRPLIRSITILHMAESHRMAKTPLETMRDVYTTSRLKGFNGQVAYYGREARKATKRLKYAQWAFVIASFSAVAATACKLAILWGGWSDLFLPMAEFIDRHDDALVIVFGLAAILLPLVAVGALSLASAFDLEARQHTFKTTHAFLDMQDKRIARSTTFHELSRLVAETEMHLLNETITWFARRSYLGVA